MLVVLFVGWTASASAQDQNWAQKMFEKLDHNFGVVATGADVRYRLKIKNIYKETVHISNVRTTCGCSAASPEKTTLASLESTFVEIVMNTTRFKRQKDSNVIVEFNQPMYARVQIPIHAYIRTDVVLTPGAANFGSIAQGAEAKKNIQIAYAGRDDWKVEDIKIEGESIEASISEPVRSPGQVRYDLAVSLKPGVPVGPVHERITVVTNDASNPYIPVLVEAKVEPDIVVTPLTYQLGSNLLPGQEKRWNVILRGRKPFLIEKVECESDLQAFKVAVPEQEKLTHLLTLVCVAPDQPGKFTETFTVTIAGRPEPVTFTATGTIAGDTATAN